MKKLACMALVIMFALTMISMVSAYDFTTRHISESFSLTKFQKDHLVDLKGVLSYKYKVDEAEVLTQEVTSLGWRIGDYIVTNSHTTWKTITFIPVPMFGLQEFPIDPMKLEIKAHWSNGEWYDVELKTVNLARDIAIFTLPEELRKVKKIPLGKLSKVELGDIVYTLGQCLRSSPPVWFDGASTWKVGIVSLIGKYQGHQEIIIYVRQESGDSSGVCIAFSNGSPKVIGLVQIDITETGLGGVIPIDYFIDEVKKLSP